MKIIIITPVFNAQVGGAAIYYQRLVRGMREAGVETVVISDRAGKPSGDGLIGLFPAWASSERRLIRDVVLYGLQNLLYLRLGKIIRDEQPDAVLVHTSFHNHPGIFSFIISKLISRFPGIRFIADARDCLLSKSKVPVLNSYHSVIACSLSVKEHLVACGVETSRLVHIPVLQERLDINEGQVVKVLEKYGLSGVNYVIYVGAVKEDKAVDVLLEAFVNRVVQSMPGYRLVLVGPLKSESRTMASLIENKNVTYLGRKDREEVLALMKGARLCINISPREGMPRASLEAIALERPAILPQNVPEFARYCPENIVPSLDVDEVGDFIIKMLEAGAVPAYPVADHYPERLLEQYMQLAAHE